jgi:hypothetical protein
MRTEHVMGKGSSRNEQKIREHQASGARVRELAAREKLKAYRSVPIAQRDADFDATIKRLSGILKKAIADGRKSETHSRKGKAGRR